MALKIDDDAIYEVRELSKILDMTERTVSKLLRDGILTGRKLGRKWYVTGSSINAYFEVPKQGGDKIEASEQDGEEE